MRLQDDEADIPAQINIVPMIDVIFAILTFFIMSTLFLTRSEGLPVNLPQAATAQPRKSAQVTVTIDPQGNIFLNREPLSVEGLPTAISQEMKPGEDLVVVLNADQSVNHGQVVQVMDQLRQVKGIKLAIATQKP